MLVVFYGRSQRVLWFNELVPDPGGSLDEYIEFYNTSTSEIPLDCYVIVSYFATKTEKGVYVYNFPSNAKIKALSYYLISSNNPVRYKSNDKTLSYSPPDNTSFSNWNNIGAGGSISKYVFANNSWINTQSVGNNFTDFISVENGNDASLLMFKINDNGTT